MGNPRMAAVSPAMSAASKNVGPSVGHGRERDDIPRFSKAAGWEAGASPTACVSCIVSFKKLQVQQFRGVFAEDLIFLLRALDPFSL